MELTAHPDAVRARVEELVRTTDRTLTAIAAEAGLSPQTVASWNFRLGWRPPAHKPRRRNDPALWPLPRRLAVAQLYWTPNIDVTDLTAALGVGKGGAAKFFAACGISARRPPPGMARPARRRGELRTALRGHVARQLERFDAALKGEAPLDSARVLRDLGGLKRLLDDLDADERVKERGDGASTDGAALRSLDLPALRAQIARRYAAFSGERADAGVPGEPAAGPGPRPLP